MTRAAILPQVYAILTALVEDRLGLHYGPEDKELFSERLAGRLDEAGFENPLDYYYRLRYDDPDGAEMARLSARRSSSRRPTSSREVDALRGRGPPHSRAGHRAARARRGRGRPPARRARSPCRSRCCSPTGASSNGASSSRAT